MLFNLFFLKKSFYTYLDAFLEVLAYLESFPWFVGLVVFFCVGSSFCLCMGLEGGDKDTLVVWHYYMAWSEVEQVAVVCFCL